MFCGVIFYFENIFYQGAGFIHDDGVEPSDQVQVIGIL